MSFIVLDDDDNYDDDGVKLSKLFCFLLLLFFEENKMNRFMSSGVERSIYDGFVCLLFIDNIWSTYQHENNLDMMSSDCQVK